mmetsp:Transcript_24081/g.48637  ORF Transcript_24081/g.48637 Transcript_24081/m.48637 type:complete len:264 (-) Transcript_24081:154-945(-)
MPALPTSKSRLTAASVPAEKTTSSSSAAVAPELRSRRLERRAPASSHTTPARSTESFVTCTVSKELAAGRSAASSSSLRSACSSEVSLQASVAVSSIVALNVATRSSGTLKALAIMDLGDVLNETDEAAMLAPLSTSVDSSIRRRVPAGRVSGAPHAGSFMPALQMNGRFSFGSHAVPRDPQHTLFHSPFAPACKTTQSSWLASGWSCWKLRKSTLESSDHFRPSVGPPAPNPLPSVPPIQTLFWFQPMPSTTSQTRACSSAL